MINIARSDGRTYKERQAHYRQMQPYGRLVGEYLLATLSGEEIT